MWGIRQPRLHRIRMKCTISLYKKTSFLYLICRGHLIVKAEAFMKIIDRNSWNTWCGLLQTSHVENQTWVWYWSTESRDLPLCLPFPPLINIRRKLVKGLDKTWFRSTLQRRGEQFYPNRIKYQPLYYDCWWTVFIKRGNNLKKFGKTKEPPLW